MQLIRPQYYHFVAFECELVDDPEIMCFPAQLNQVFMNLSINACQAIAKRRANSPGAAPPGRFTIRLALDPPNDALTITFEDNGCGMTPEVQTRIFEPFYTTKDVGEGTGLGLSISFGIIKDHHGRIEVESAPDQGSRFVVTLPMSSA